MYYKQTKNVIKYRALEWNVLEFESKPHSLGDLEQSHYLLDS